MDPLDRRYFDWLYSQVGSVKDRVRTRTYWSLARQLFQTEFVWFVPNDDNRLKDGQALRPEFLASVGIPPENVDWMNSGCSVLEMLLGLSRRASEEAYSGGPADWFWHLIDNLGIKFNDFDYNGDVEAHIAGVLNDLIFRQYKPDGRGGLFPLKEPRQDQRHVELWYQLNTYLLERE